MVMLRAYGYIPKNKKSRTSLDLLSIGDTPVLNIFAYAMRIYNYYIEMLSKIDKQSYLVKMINKISLAELQHSFIS